jgi:hypothetical protein
LMPNRRRMREGTVNRPLAVILAEFNLSIVSHEESHHPKHNAKIL